MIMELRSDSIRFYSILCVLYIFPRVTNTIKGRFGRLQFGVRRGKSGNYHSTYSIHSFSFQLIIIEFNQCNRYFFEAALFFFLVFRRLICQKILYRKESKIERMKESRLLFLLFVVFVLYFILLFYRLFSLSLSQFFIDFQNRIGSDR